MASRRIWTNARVVTGLARTLNAPLEIATTDGRIAAVGPDLSHVGAGVVDCGRHLITPVFTACHTHLVHGGDRARERQKRPEGASYEQISKAGGGVTSPLRATRGLGVDALVASALLRLDALLAEGVSMVEIKSGYGLEVETELNMLLAAHALEPCRPIRIDTTWLASLAMPPDFSGSKANSIRDVAIAGLGRAHAEGLVDWSMLSARASHFLRTKSPRLLPTSTHLASG